MMLEESYPEEQAKISDDNMNQALEQFAFMELNSQFSKVKKQSISNFLEAQEKNLKKHIADRANNLLGSARQMEEKNLREIVNKVIKNVVGEVDVIESEPSKEEGRRLRLGPRRNPDRQDDLQGRPGFGENPDQDSRGAQKVQRAESRRVFLSGFPTS